MEAGPTPTSFQQQFFRNTGLGVLNDLNTWLRGRRHRSEQKKIVISTSRWTALSRCGVHVLPVLVSIAIIIINIRQVYIGIDFQSLVTSETINIAFLQTAAKLQELLIVASLTTIVFQLLRDELLYGDGIPLGLIGAGIDFTKLSYFWSPEILGSVTSLFRGRRKYRKIQLGLFLILAGALALLAGPSCAVLLVPQNQDWPAGGTSLFLNGTKDEFWPVELTANSSQASTCSSSSGTRYGICPSGGYHCSGRIMPSLTTRFSQMLYLPTRKNSRVIVIIGLLRACSLCRVELFLWVNRKAVVTSSNLTCPSLYCWIS